MENPRLYLASPVWRLSPGSCTVTIYSGYDWGLRRAKTKTSPVLLIAAVAMASELIIVTNNEKEFRRISGLKVENWKE
jgi:predicted nucleic acid-binding protein